MMIGALALALAIAPPHGAPFEPPAGRILHFAGGVGGQRTEVDAYEKAMGPALQPCGYTAFVTIPGTRGLAGQIAGLKDILGRAAREGFLVNVGLGFDNGKIAGFATAADREVAEGDTYDAAIDEVVKTIVDSDAGVLLRIGIEVNGDWNGLHPFVFPKAYRKIVERFRAAGAKRVAFVWCIEPSGDRDVAARDDQGEWKWFPGDDVVDWYGLDLFSRWNFDGPPPSEQSRTGELNPWFVTDAVLKMAKKAKKPVIVGEASPFKINLVADADDPGFKQATKQWSIWFEPLIAWLDDNKQVKALTIMPVDWRKTTAWAEWGDSRLHQNSRLVSLWSKELKKKRWVHRAELKDVLGPD